MTKLLYPVATLIILLAVFQGADPTQLSSYFLPAILVFFLLSFLVKKALTIAIGIGLVAVVVYTGIGEMITIIWNQFAN